MLSVAPLASAPREQTSVPLMRLDFADAELLEELMGAVRDVAERGAFTLGEPVESFEREFAAYCETDFAVGVSSGTEALVLALRALEIGPGDEVIVPTNSFIATAEAVSAVGATPRLVDVDPDSHLLTAALVADNLNARVRCVIPVHLFGATVDLDPILKLTQATGIHVIEDACQAHGARYQGRPVGAHGDLGCFSFYPTKNLGAWGDGGAVVTSDPELAERVQLLRAHGERPRYQHRVVGTTARLDALQAAVLRHKLLRLEHWNEQRRRLGAVLRERLEGDGRDALGANGPGHGPAAIDLVRPPFAGADHVYHLFVVRTEARDALREHLSERGIASAIHYPTPIHLTEAYAHLGLGAGSLPVSEDLSRRICSLPLFPSMTDAESERISAAVLEFAEDRVTDQR
jgi:dTDP-3-amino-3,4,6-trideoxy-alpha-D-glucose transaminase